MTEYDASWLAAVFVTLVFLVGGAVVWIVARLQR